MAEQPQDFWSTIPAPPNPQDDPDYRLVREMLRKETMNAAGQEPPKFKDPYAPGEREQIQKSMADRRKLGEILMLTGDEPSTALGRTLAKEDPNAFKQEQSRQDQVREYQQWQADQSGNKVTVLTKALEAMADASGPQQKTIPSGRLADHEADAKQVRGLSRAQREFKPEYTQALGRRMGVEGFVPKTIEDLARWAVTSVPKLTNPMEREAAQWWANLDRDVFAEMRARLFGATLTTNEQRAFEQLRMMSPSMNPEDILASLENLYRVNEEGAKDRIIGSVSNYGPGHLPHFKRIFGELFEPQSRQQTSGKVSDLQIIWADEQEGPGAKGTGTAGKAGIPIEVEKI